MYCINCGVKLAASEKKCPLCGTVPYHPDLPRESGEPLYPVDQYPAEVVKPKVVQGAMLFFFLLPMVITLLVDLQVDGQVTWSGYVIGALILCYLFFLLPAWFRKPNPVIFVPCDFAAVILYLLYIDLTLEGNWFLSFAFPVAGGIGLIVTAVVTLLRYIRRGRLYILGGAVMALGACMLLIEFLLVVTFEHYSYVGWSLYPLAALFLLGGLMIYLAINRSARETVERKVFF